MATITVQRIDTNGEPVLVGGVEQFLTDNEAVAQIIGTQLALLEGEWWEDLTVGLPLFQEILGVSRSTDVVAGIIKAKILAAPYVLSISSVQCFILNRQLSYSCIVTTQFGTLVIATGGSVTQQ